MVQAADHLLQARAAIAAAGHHGLRALSDLTLFELGKILARRIRT
jgi:hypothetical protein